MNKTVFRPVEFWKSAVMTMPDNSFFELIRSVFGKIKTPFNKQQLINELEAFLLRDDIRRAAASYIDRNDGKVIAAIALFGEPVPGDLESFFSGELSYAELQDIIVNLEERFILYRFREENPHSKTSVSRLALNPVLEQTLLPFTEDASPLFPTADVSPSPQAAPQAGLNDLILAGLLSFVLQGEPFFRGEGVIRKKIIEAGKTHFPGIDLGLTLGGLQALGLFYVDEDRLVPDTKRFNGFGSLSARERMEYCAASLMVFSEKESPDNILPPLLRGRIREIANFIHCLLDSLTAELLYPTKTLQRLTEVIRADMGGGVMDNTQVEDCINNYLEKAGLLVSASPQIKQLGPNAKRRADTERKAPLIAVDSGFSVLVYPEIDFADAISLASFLNIKEAGPVVRFEMERDSVVRAFDRNIGADEIIELLKRLSGGRVNDNLIWTLKDWEKRHSEVSLKKGVVLSLSQEKRYLTETRALRALITETLAPGLYLLPESAMNEAASALHSAGIDIVARREREAKTSASSYNHFPSLSSPKFLPQTRTLGMHANKKEEAAAKARSKAADADTYSEASGILKANFHAILEKTPMGKTEKAELSARINRRLVLCEAQLKEADVRYEKLEARHMDYAGKQNIARQAVAQQSPLEIVWPGRGKNGQRIFGVPRALEKEGGELFMIIASGLPAADGQEEILRIPLGKISLLRRIKKSIFEI